MEKTFGLFLVILIFLLSSFTNSYNQIKILEEIEYKTTKVLINAKITANNASEILTKIGLKEDTIKNLSPDSLKEYENAKKIYSTNLKLFVEEKTDNLFIKNPSWEFSHNMNYEGNNGLPDNVKKETLTDDYMEITYIFTDLGKVN